MVNGSATGWKVRCYSCQYSTRAESCATRLRITNNVLERLWNDRQRRLVGIRNAGTTNDGLCLKALNLSGWVKSLAATRGFASGRAGNTGGPPSTGRSQNVASRLIASGLLRLKPSLVFPAFLSPDRNGRCQPRTQVRGRSACLISRVPLGTTGAGLGRTSVVPAGTKQRLIEANHGLTSVAVACRPYRDCKTCAEIDGGGSQILSDILSAIVPAFLSGTDCQIVGSCLDRSLCGACDSR